MKRCRYWDSFNFYNCAEAARIAFLIKRCSENMQQIYRRIPMPKCNFIETTLWHWIFPVNLLYIFRKTFSKIPLEGCFYQSQENNT